MIRLDLGREQKNYDDKNGQGASTSKYLQFWFSTGVPRLRIPSIEYYDTKCLLEELQKEIPNWSAVHKTVGACHLLDEYVVENMPSKHVDQLLSVAIMAVNVALISELMSSRFVLVQKMPAHALLNICDRLRNISTFNLGMIICHVFGHKRLIFKQGTYNMMLAKALHCSRNTLNPNTEQNADRLIQIITSKPDFDWHKCNCTMQLFCHAVQKDCLDIVTNLLIKSHLRLEKNYTIFNELLQQTNRDAMIKLLLDLGGKRLIYNRKQALCRSLTNYPHLFPRILHAKAGTSFTRILHLLARPFISFNNAMHLIAYSDNVLRYFANFEMAHESSKAQWASIGIFWGARVSKRLLQREQIAYIKKPSIEIALALNSLQIPILTQVFLLTAVCAPFARCIPFAAKFAMLDLIRAQSSKQKQ